MFVPRTDVLKFLSVIFVCVYVFEENKICPLFPWLILVSG
jgi:hypothetical protein